MTTSSDMTILGITLAVVLTTYVGAGAAYIKLRHRRAVGRRYGWLLAGVIPISVLTGGAITWYLDFHRIWSTSSVIELFVYAISAAISAFWALLAVMSVLSDDSPLHNSLESLWIVTNRRTIDQIRSPAPGWRTTGSRSIEVPRAEMTNGDIVDTFNRFDLASILRIIGNIQYASRPLSKWLESSGEFTILGVDELNLQDHRDVIRSIWPKWTDERFAELFELHGSKLALARFCFPSGADGVLFASFNDELWEAPVWSASKELAMLPLSAHRISDLERRARDA